jgi:hypothetical protein
MDKHKFYLDTGVPTSPDYELLLPLKRKRLTREKLTSKYLLEAPPQVEGLVHAIKSIVVS